jgi:hypothetical protein
MRPYWKGYLKLALVSCPIALHAACSSAERIAFRQINKATGNRLRQQLIDEETREPVAPEHKGRGYEVAKGQYLIVEDAELEAIEIESTHTIEIDRFVLHSAIDQRRCHGAGVRLSRPFLGKPKSAIRQTIYRLYPSPSNRTLIKLIPRTVQRALINLAIEDAIAAEESSCKKCFP